MKARKTLTCVERPERQVPRRLRFERLESRHMLSGWGWSDAVAGTDAGPADGVAPATVMIRLQATDLCGQPIDRVAVGDRFWLEVYARDLRAVPKGVFAAYLDVNYDPTLVSIGKGEDAGLIFGTTYENGKSGEFLPGLIDEAGAFAGMAQTYGDEYLVFAVPLTATAAGVAEFAGRPADPIWRDILVYDSDSSVPWDEVRMLGAQLIVESNVEADGAAGGLGPGAVGNPACRAAPVAGSGAELAAANPLWRPREKSSKGPIHPVEAYEPADPAGRWPEDGAPVTVTEPSPSGGWTDEWRLGRAHVRVIPLAFEWIQGGDAVGRWLDSGTDSHPISADPYGFRPILRGYLSPPRFWSSPDTYTITLSEPVSDSLTRGSFGLDSGSESVVFRPAESSAVDAGAGLEFAMFEAPNAGSRLAPASFQDSDASWTNGGHPWQPSGFPGWTVPARIELPTALAPRSVPAALAQRPIELEMQLTALESVLDELTAELAPAGR